MMTPASRASQVAGSIEISARRRGKPRRRQLGPERRNALRFAQVRAELLLGTKMLPPAAALKLANVAKPPLRERVPFLGNLVEADSALHNRHLVPPGTRDSRHATEAQ